eukprot:TRINITY_DN5934_c0_g1_i1.p2 TRINITY_DN5934_c0_g1~~TRINITY_DN5934_c0_g1_i1.p2  ORF type:complete len:113 (+),score=30.14 TRINITY_DN5934_c0_g1_i1:79-417(+)
MGNFSSTRVQRVTVFFQTSEEYEYDVKGCVDFIRSEYDVDVRVDDYFDKHAVNADVARCYAVHPDTRWVELYCTHKPGCPPVLTVDLLAEVMPSLETFFGEPLKRAGETETK